MPWRGLLHRLTGSLSRSRRPAPRLEGLEDRLVPDGGPVVTTEAPLVTASPSFPVRWSAYDPDGIAGFDVYASTDGGPFVLWQDDTDLSTATWTRQVRSPYALKEVRNGQLGNTG